MITPGKVYIIGAGPGNPELLTLKGKRLLEEARVVVYDRLVSDDVLLFINPKAERIFVGKKSYRHIVPQDEINRLLITRAKSGETIIRLKGGDPYLFGRGSEEAEILFKEGIPFEVVPGITAASGVGAYAGIPLTDRRYASGVTFVTGHKKNDPSQPDINWDILAKLNHTLVIYMGVSNLNKITRNLQENNMDPQTPAAVVRCGTVKEQITVKGTLSNIYEKVIEKGIKAPALLILGDVINLQIPLNWYERNGFKH